MSEKPPFDSSLWLNTFEQELNGFLKQKLDTLEADYPEESRQQLIKVFHGMAKTLVIKATTAIMSVVVYTGQKEVALSWVEALRKDVDYNLDNLPDLQNEYLKRVMEESGIVPTEGTETLQ